MNNEWLSQLKSLGQAYRHKKIMDEFESDPKRAQRYSLEYDGLLLDYSKNVIDDKVLSTLMAFAQAHGLKENIARLLAGDKVNVTENRPALHTALRRLDHEGLVVNGINVMTSIANEKAKMAALVEKIHQENNIRAVVNLGIGGSDLGPKMVTQALKAYRQTAMEFYFVSNVDPCALHEVLERLDPKTTLFVISSKSFTTPETLLNATMAKEWLAKELSPEVLLSHFVAVTSKPEKAKAWGIADNAILAFEEWVGGRYSVWSTIGFPVALSVGMAHFESFLAGARSMDNHFQEAPFEKNMPVLLALIGLWYVQGFGATTQAVLPYSHGLRRFADYLQQLDMESNGKSVHIDGASVDNLTGPIVWGQAGTNGQHAFYQLLHQGTHYIPVDFIAFKESTTAFDSQHTVFVANALAQAQALLQGCENENAHDVMPGNRPSNMLLFKKLTPYTLGQLLALYEHKVAVQGLLWRINSFDQPGVELGKKLAQEVTKAILNKEENVSLDPSTRQLVHYLNQ